MPTKQVGLLHTGSKKVFGDLVKLSIDTANEWLADNKSTFDVKLTPNRTRYVEDDLDQLEDDADELIEEKSDIILAAGGPQSAIAARDATAEAAADLSEPPNVVGVVVTADGFFNNNRTKIIEEAAAPDPANNRVGVPTIYQWKEFTDNFTDSTGVEQNGGLMSFGPSMTEAYKKAGEYIGRVANGTAPSDIECSKPEENLIEVWVNERTARHHGFDLTKIPAQLGNKPVNRRP